ncbi:MAG TPA: C25 family cysteine peptidase, partial [Bacteroidales bacterium]|nr:C25 family cysteine peptidase [Bacteroidales bacterium]
YYSPSFGNLYAGVWNYKAPATKDALSQYPIKYVIVSSPMFEEALQPFIEWKTKKGFTVIEAYTNNPSVGTTVTSIHNYLKGLYDAATIEDPAPTYVLLVGDLAQIPATNAGQHYSDMYTVEFDGGSDYVPDMYIGRFSATNVTQLQPQIDKTLMFEEYTFPDPAFLDKVVLVAGADNNYGPTHANGQINYANQYYFNSAHGMDPYVYLYPASANSETAILGNLSSGVGFVNYTAHCGSDGWGDPSFTTSNIPSLQNDNEYFFSIGNCCLSNKFDESECFGEALLRAQHKGAVVHIGGSNSTLWNEDFYWSVGVTATINANPTYSGTTQAAYDHLFHENGEDPYVDAAQITYMGNMSVMQSSSSEDEYYWEIYHVMGDPSLMPYAGVPSELEADYFASVPIGVSQLLVSTEPGAYVAISLDGVLLDARLADENGEALLQFEAFSTVCNPDVVATKQFRSPYIGTLQVIPNDNDYDAMLKSIVLPTNIMNIADATFQPTFEIMNLGQLNLTSVTVSYQIDEESPVQTAWTGDLDFLGVTTVLFDEITLAEGQHTITASVSMPNGNTDQYPSNDQMTKNFLVYSGNVSLLTVESPIEIYCNENSFVPEITIKNLDPTPLTSLTCAYTVGLINYEFVWTGNVAQNQTTNIQFPEASFASGNHTIEFTISEPNGGSDMNDADNYAEKDFRINSPGQIVHLTLLTDNYGTETTWELSDNESQAVLYSAGPYTNSVATFNYDWCLGEGCYTFTILDSYGDGMSGSSWFGIPPGHVTITNTVTSEVYFDLAGDDFEDSAEDSFCITIDNSNAISKTNATIVFPNPASDFVNVIASEPIIGLTVINSLGQSTFCSSNESDNIVLDTKDYVAGIYILKVETVSGISIHKLQINK